MKKYPYIGEFNDYSMVLFLGKGEGFVLKHPITPLYKLDSNWCEGQFKNITREYLKNTWGVVESKEHSDFIIELAELHGFKVDENSGNPKSFMIYDDVIGIYSFSHKKLSNQKCRKQIAIPLPPKAKEWMPEVGDEVVAVHPCNKLEGKILALTKEYAIISQPHGEQHLHLSSWSFEKPKSAQELKIEELQTKLCENNAVDNYILACDIVMGNIEGLSYE